MAAVRRNVSIVSQTVVDGYVNDQRYVGSIEAEFHTERGGRSTCEFSALPERFDPTTLGTHT
jgi:hypothetical protein